MIYEVLKPVIMLGFLGIIVLAVVIVVAGIRTLPKEDR